MKSEIISNTPSKDEIDWRIPQLLKSTTSSLVVLTSGYYDSNTFKGTVIISNDNHEIGKFYEKWVKVSFEKVELPITIKFS